MSKKSNREEILKNRVKKYAKKAYGMMAEIKRDKKGNPLTFEDTIRSIILKNPERSSYRDDALGIMYCVLGAGVGWIDGRLGDTTPNNYINMPPSAVGQGCWSIDFGMSESLKQIFGDDLESIKKYKFSWMDDEEEKVRKICDTIDNIDKRCQEYCSNRTSWYPISWYACNLCVPADAQEDFFNGAIETAQLILATKPTMGTERWITHQRTKEYAEQILKALILRKEKK